MVAPGWNVTEPLHVLVQIIKTIDAVQFAPEEAQDFKAQIESFADSLRGLQTVLESLQIGLENFNTFDARSARLVNLKSKLDASWDCIRRCEEFSKRFNNIANTQAKFAVRTGQAGRWVWNKKHATHLSGQLESHIRDISLKLQIENFSQEQSKATSPVIQGKSPVAQPVFDPLPPPGYAANGYSPQQEVREVLTPQRLLRRKPYNAHNLAVTPTRGPRESTRSDKQLSQTAARAATSHRRRSSLLAETLEEDRPVHFPTFGQASVSPDYSQSEYSASTITQRWSFASTASEISTIGTSLSLSPSIRPKPADIDFQNVLPRRPTQIREIEQEMRSLQDVFTFVKRGSVENPEAVSAIERFRRDDLREIHIIFTPLAKSIYRYVLKLSLGSIVIPRTEHPMSQGSEPKFCVKMPSAKFIAERPHSRRGSVASSVRSDLHSTGSMEYDPSTQYCESHSEFPQSRFILKSEQNNKDFQGLLMGCGIKLQKQIPVNKISSNVQKESSLQNIRLFHRERRQYLVFYANVPSKKTHKQFDMMMFAPQDVKSKTTIRLVFVGTQTLPERLRTRSAPSQAQIQQYRPVMGLTKEIDPKDLEGLQYLDINFESEGDLKTFKNEARYNGVMDEHLLPEMTFHDEPG